MIYVTSDLHGYPLQNFKETLRILSFSDDDFCFILGDVIDRGDDGIEILKWLMRQHNIELILGNHEAMLLACDFLLEEITDTSLDTLYAEKLGAAGNWIHNGALPTLNSLKEESPQMRAEILEYLRCAPLYETVTAGGHDYILTHAGLGNFDAKKRLSDYAPDDLLWHRPTISERYFDDIVTVFGHTPTVIYGEEYRGRVLHTDTWIDIDTGSGHGMKPTILCLDDMREVEFC